MLTMASLGGGALVLLWPRSDKIPGGGALVLLWPCWAQVRVWGVSRC